LIDKATEFSRFQALFPQWGEGFGLLGLRWPKLIPNKYSNWLLLVGDGDQPAFWQDSTGVSLQDDL